MIPSTSLDELIGQLTAARDAGAAHLVVQDEAGNCLALSWTVRQVGDIARDDVLDTTGTRYLDATLVVAE